MAITFQSMLASAAGALQTKTVTPTTSQQVVTPDQGYNGLSQVTVDAVPYGAAVTTADTVTKTLTPDPGEFFSSVTINPTPSQTKSATPTTSSQDITPDSGNLLSKVTVGAIPSEYVIPTAITPSDSSPVSMTADAAYKPSTAGYAIASSPTSVSPSSSGTYFSSGIKRMTSSGYACSSQPPKAAYGTATISTANAITINLGFKPKYLMARSTNANGDYYVTNIYDERIPSKFWLYASSSSNRYVSLPSSGTNQINEITNSGFTYGKGNTTYPQLWYFAIG